MLLLNTRRALAPAAVLQLPYLKVQNILQTFSQDTIPSLWSEKSDEYLFGQAKTRFQVRDREKKEHERKI